MCLEHGISSNLSLRVLAYMGSAVTILDQLVNEIWNFTEWCHRTLSLYFLYVSSKTHWYFNCTTWPQCLVSSTISVSFMYHRDLSCDHVSDIVDVNTNTTTMLLLIVESMTLKLKVKQKLAYKSVLWPSCPRHFCLAVRKKGEYEMSSCVYVCIVYVLKML